MTIAAPARKTKEQVMYTAKLNEETRTDVLHGIMREAPLATLVTYGMQGLEVNHIPMVIAPNEGPHGTLRGHVARANPVWRNLRDGGECVAVFRAADYYISPSWYPSKKLDPRTVPTWNYVVVHAHGTVKAIEDSAWLSAHLEELTNQQESGRDHRWRVADAPEDFLEKLRGAIVGIEFAITRLDGKVKASQNRSAEDRAGVIQGLLTENREMASAMARWVPD
jgi:transcriptional regulator